MSTREPYWKPSMITTAWMLSLTMTASAASSKLPAWTDLVVERVVRAAHAPHVRLRPIPVDRIGRRDDQHLETRLARLALVQIRRQGRIAEDAPRLPPTDPRRSRCAGSRPSATHRRPSGPAARTSPRRAGRCAHRERSAGSARDTPSIAPAGRWNQTAARPRRAGCRPGASSGVAVAQARLSACSSRH